ncbi:40S ribosomal protein S15 [Capsicum chinense]|nr:40S ribosomal protein S15 [Capsicum chinense]
MYHSADMCAFNSDSVMFAGNAQKTTMEVDVELTLQLDTDKVVDNSAKLDLTTTSLSGDVIIQLSSLSYRPMYESRKASKYIYVLDTSSNSLFYKEADVETDVTTAGQPKKRTFKKFSYRGVDLDALLDMSTDELVKLFNARPRRRFQRGLKRKPMALIKKLRKAKREAPPGEKPEPVKTHLRNMIIVPEMIGSIIGIYNGKTFNQIEVKPEMIGHYLAEFSISYKPVKHGRPGIGATHSSRFIPLK